MPTPRSDMPERRPIDDRPTGFRARLVLTGLGLAALIAIILLQQIAKRGGWTIAQAEDWKLILPAIALAITLMATTWAFMFHRQRHGNPRISRVLIGIAIFAAVATVFLGFRAIAGDREIAMSTYTCPSEMLRTRNATPNPDDDCTAETRDVTLSIGSPDNPTYRTPTGSGEAYLFENLPSDTWKARLHATADPDVVGISIVDTSTDSSRTLAAMSRTTSGEWTATFDFPADADRFALLYHTADAPAVPSASVRFAVMACEGQSIRSFDAAGCTPTTVNLPLIGEANADGAHIWRYPVVEVGEAGQRVVNLEARTYTLTALPANVQSQTGSADMLVLPAAGNQTTDRAVAAPGQLTFEVNVTASSGPLEYVIYVFPSGGAEYAGVAHTIQFHR